MAGAGDAAAALELLRSWAAGERVGSDWICIDQARIDRFAEATGDHYWLHVDPQRAARESPYGLTIAHGFLLLSLTVGDEVAHVTSLPGIAHVLNYGLDKVRFLRPVTCGSQVRVRTSAASLTERRSGEWLWRQTKTLDVQGSGDPALIAEQLVLVRLAD